MIIKKAVVDDAEEIAELLNEMKNDYVPPLSLDLGDYYLDKEELVKKIREGVVEWFVARADNGLLLGVISIDKSKPTPYFKRQMKNSAFIEIFGVHPGKRGEGIGNHLLKRAETVKDKGIEWLWTKTWTNPTYSVRTPEHKEIAEKIADDFKKTHGYDGLRPNQKMVWLLLKNNYEIYMGLPDYVGDIPELAGRSALFFRKRI